MIREGRFENPEQRGVSRTYYEVLGIGTNATDAELKRAFRKKVRQCHPDLFPGDPAKEEEFKAVNEAYEVLSDQSQRVEYDRLNNIEPSAVIRSKEFKDSKSITPHKQTPAEKRGQQAYEEIRDIDTKPRKGKNLEVKG